MSTFLIAFALFGFQNPPTPVDGKANLHIRIDQETYSAVEPIRLTASYTGIPPDEGVRIYRFVPGRANSYYVLLDVKGPVVSTEDRPLKAIEHAPGMVGFGIETYRTRKSKPDEQTFRDEAYTFIRAFPQEGDNGLLVGDVKQYDESSLLAKIQALNAQLSGLALIGGSALTGAFGQFQGGTLSSTASAFQIGSAPTPTVTTTATSPVTNTSTYTPNVTGLSNLPSAAQLQLQNPGQTQQVNGATNQTVTTAPTNTATAPALPTPSTFAFTPTFGMGAAGILDEQMEISYEVINLQMLLEGSLTDKFIGSEPSSNQQSLSQERYRTVLGIPITIMPSKRFKNAVAEVDLSLVTDSPINARPPSLVAMIPMQNSYNVAKESSTATSFGVAASISALSLGAASGSSQQTIYLVRDQDTLALQFPPESHWATMNPSTHFGWQFRPVLDESTVRPGLRTLFASVSLPKSMAEKWNGHIRIETRWRCFDKQTRAVGRVIEGSRQIQNTQDLDFPSGRVAISEGGSQQYAATWTDAGDGKSASVMVLGSSFTPGTFVQAGPVSLGTSNGLILTQRSLNFTVPGVLFGTSDPYVISPFGANARVIAPGVGRAPMSFQAKGATWKAIDEANGLVTVTFDAPTHWDESQEPAFPLFVGPCDAPDPNDFVDPEAAGDANVVGSAKDTPDVRLLAIIGGSAFGLNGSTLTIKQTKIVEFPKPTVPPKKPGSQPSPTGPPKAECPVKPPPAPHSWPLPLEPYVMPGSPPRAHGELLPPKFPTYAREKPSISENVPPVSAFAQAAQLTQMQSIADRINAQLNSRNIFLQKIGLSQLKPKGYELANDQPKFFDEYEASFIAPVALLKVANQVELVAPLWGDHSVSSTELKPGDDPPKVAEIGDDGAYATFQLSVPKDTRWPFALLNGSSPIQLYCLAPPDDGKPGVTKLPAPLGPFLFRLSSNSLNGTEQLSFLHWSAVPAPDTPTPEFKLVPHAGLKPTPEPCMVPKWSVSAISLAAAPPKQIAVVESVHVHDEFHITLTGGDLSALQTVLFNGRPLPITHAGKNVQVPISREETRNPGRRELTLIFEHAHDPVFVSFEVQP